MDQQRRPKNGMGLKIRVDLAQSQIISLNLAHQIMQLLNDLTQ